MFDHTAQEVFFSWRYNSKFYPSGLFKNAAGCKNVIKIAKFSLQFNILVHTTTKCIDNVLRVEVFVLNNFGMVINTIEARLFRVGFGKVNVCKSCGELSLFCTICMVCKFWPMAKYCNFKKKSKFMRQNYIFKLSILPLLLLDPN